MGRIQMIDCSNLDHARRSTIEELARMADGAALACESEGVSDEAPRYRFVAKWLRCKLSQEPTPDAPGGPNHTLHRR
jgi:hypothetical protein